MDLATQPTQVIRIRPAREITSELLIKWISSLDTPSNSFRTRKTYFGAIKQLLQYFSLTGIKSPEKEDLLAWKESLKASGLSPGTINLYITAARLFFQFLENAGIYENIASGIKGLTLSKFHKKGALKETEAGEVIEAATNARDKAILSLMFSSGLRCIEIARADIDDFFTSGGRPFLYILRKGRTEKEPVPLEPETYKALLAYLSGKEKNTGALFTGASRNHSRGSRLSTRSISGIVKAAMIKAGYNSPQLTAHSTRHSAATIALDNGASIEQVSQLLGHSNINTTMIYIHQKAILDNPCPTIIGEAIAKARGDK